MYQFEAHARRSVALVADGLSCRLPDREIMSVLFLFRHGSTTAGMQGHFLYHLRFKSLRGGSITGTIHGQRRPAVPE
jgi:hypothetical protein